MASSLIGALRVHLHLDSAEFSEGLKKSQSRMKEFGNALKVGIAAAAAAVAAGGALAAAAIKGIVDEADEMSKASQKLGVPIDELSRLRHAADMSGVSFEGLGNGIKRLSANMADVAGGAVGPAAEAFKALDIEVQNSDGTLKSSSQIMTEIAGKFGNMEDGAGKTAIAMAIFGKAGADLIPMLNGGADGLADMLKEADELGIVLDAKTGKAAENFNDNLSRLQKVNQGIWTQLTARLLPTLESFSNMMVDAAKNTKGLDEVAAVLGGTFKTLVSAGVIVVSVFRQIGRVLSAVTGAISQLIAGEFRAAFETMKEYGVGAVDNLKATIETIKQVWTDEGNAIEDAAPELGKKIAAPIMHAVETTETWAGRIKKMLADTGRVHNDLMRQGQQVWTQTRTPAEKYSEELERLNGLLEYGAINHDTYARAVAQAQQEMQAALEKTNEAAQANQTAYESWMRGVSDGFTDAIFKAKSFGDVLKQLLVQLAKAEFSNWIFGGLTGKSGGGSIIGGMAKALGFAGGFDKGGFIPPGQWGITGESGPEITYGGRTGAQVIPMRDIGGGGMVINIDARQATDPAAVRLQVMEGIQQAMPQITARATKATFDQMSRPRIS